MTENTGGPALDRMTAMQELLRQAEADHEVLSAMADRLSAYFEKVDALRGYLDDWMGDREAILAADEAAGRTDVD